MSPASAAMRTGTPWLRRFHPRQDSEIELFCFPHAGGSASAYFQLSQLLAPTVQVSAVQYPGRQDRRSEPRIDSIDEFADRMCAELLSQPARPFAMFGHSMGAVIAYETAQRLTEAGRVPVWFFSSSRRAPSRLRHTDVHRRDDAGIVAELRSLAGGDVDWLADEELLASFLPAIRSDYQAIETHPYRPGPPLRCPITAFMGDQDPYTTQDEAASWQDHCTGSFDLHVFPGGHFYFDNHTAQVAAHVNRVLGTAAGVAPHGEA
ncbi:alpha/beta fold hydrolase [Dactylosporangium cerinum]